MSELKYKVGDKFFVKAEIVAVDGSGDSRPYQLKTNLLHSPLWTTKSIVHSLLEANKPLDCMRPQVTQTVVVPAFIDNYIRYTKVEGMSLFIAMENAQNKESEWIITNEETFARAWLDGYNIEKQKYVVAIPDGRGDGGVAQLWKNSGGLVLLNFGAKTRYGEAYKLTEEEIKRNHAPLWGTEWVKEVE